MSALDDPEDGPSNGPPSRLASRWLPTDAPPNEIPTAPFASDRPLPPHDELPSLLPGEAQTERPPATNDDIRDLLESALVQLANLNEWRINADKTLASMNVGVGSCLHTVTECAANVERISDNIIILTAICEATQTEVQQIRTHTMGAVDKLGARVVKLEDWHIEATGTNNGSLTAAAIQGPGGE